MSSFILLPILLALSAFFSGSETALFSLKRHQLAAFAGSRNPLKHLVVRLLTQPRKLLVTVLLGNLLVNVTFYAVASAEALALARTHGRLAAAAAGILIPVVVIILGEVTPKTLALGSTEAVSSVAAPLLFVLRTALWPLRVVITAIARGLSHLLAGHHPRSAYVTSGELKMLIATGEEQGLIHPHESLMMQELVDFGRVLVRDVMVPRVDMVMFCRNRPLEELLDIIRRTHHLRIPVYGTSVDDILGIVDTRGLLLDRTRLLDEHIRRAYFVPETKTVESLLAEFREQKRTFAIVVDEYGGTAGLVTLEDAVEVIVGEIHDEYDQPEELVQDLSDNRYLLSGRVPIADWAEMFGMSVAERRLASLGGLLIRLLGHLPHEGEQIRHGNVLFTVRKTRGHRIEQVLVEFAEPPQNGKEDG